MTDTALKSGLAALVLVGALALSACAYDGEDSSAEVVKPAKGEERSSAVAREHTQEAMSRAVTTVTVTEGMGAYGSVVSGGRTGNGPPVSEYEVQKNGTLVIGGDVLVKCRDVGIWTGPPPATRSVKQQIRKEQRKQIKACTEAGFSPKNTPR